MIATSKPFKNIVTTVLLSVIFCACHNYYMAIPTRRQTTIETAGSIDTLQKTNRYFTLRSGIHAWYMKDIALGADQKILSCRLDPVSYLHKLDFTPGRLYLLILPLNRELIPYDFNHY